MKRNNYNFRRLLAFLLSVMLMISNLGLTSFADGSAAESAGSLVSGPPSDEEMIIVEGPEDLSAVNAGEEYQQEGPSTPIETLAAEGGLFSEPESAPFEQVYTIGDVNITVAADTGVFPEDAVLNVDGIEDGEITHAAEDALGISESDTVLIHHSLYSFSGTEIYGPADVKMEPAGYSAVREAYPNAGIDFHMMCWDGECRNAQEIMFDFDKEQDRAEFATSVLTVYDLVAVIRLSEQEEPQETVMQPETVRTGQPLEYRTGQPGVPQTEETVEQSGEGQTEESTEQLSEIQTEGFTDQLREMQTEGFAELFAEMQTEGFTEPFTETRTEGFTEPLTETRTEGFMDLFEETQTGEPAEQPAETQTGEPAEQPTETQTGEPAELLSETQTEESTEQLTETQTEESKEAPDDEETETEAEAFTESMQFSPAFEESRTVGDVTITVKADPGVFPEGTVLSIERVTALQQHQADAAVDEMRDEGVNVAASETYDIKAIDSETGEEYQPGEGQTVNISFALSQVADENLETQVYHVKEDEATGELTAESLEVNTEEIPQSGGELAAVVETDGFSLYTVEFTYSNLEYVLPGDTSAPLSEVLTAVGLTGEVTAVQVSNSSLISASKETGEWIVTAHQAFDTTEWMKVTINGVVFEIKVTDDQTVTANSTTWTGTMIVTEDVTIESRVRVNGDVILFLSEGTTLTAPEGIFVTTGNSLTINGSGTLNAGSDNPEAHASFCAGIGGGWAIYRDEPGRLLKTVDADCGTIIINGGTINARGSKLYKHSYNDNREGGFAAGIGGGAAFETQLEGGSGGSITINGGTVNAWGYDGGAGIGGGGGNSDGHHGGNSGTITINGGTVQAYAVPNQTYTYLYGAGIGGGKYGRADQIIIQGNANVTAVGYGSGAGIGGGAYSNGSGGQIIIGGSAVVNATCEKDATGTVEWGTGAGIGSGESESSPDIIIKENALVTATSRNGGAGIGSGAIASSRSITIQDNASVTASSRVWGAGIGGGYECNAGTIMIRGNAVVNATSSYAGAGIGGGGFAHASTEESGGSVTIDGGTVTATGTDGTSYGYGAGIGSGWMGSIVTVTINGGTVNATGGEWAAGIGGGYKREGKVQINGGAVTAIAGKYGAAIGGGGGANGGEITIKGGTVTAEAKASSSSDITTRGAAIGGGGRINTGDITDPVYVGGSGGKISIEGGTVTAVNDFNSAAIGGAAFADGGEITISGNAKVTATGGSRAAAIGGGLEGGSGTIKISGGEVTAIAGIFGPGIGIGEDGSGGTIEIIGGKVTAKGSLQSAAIGGGNNSDGGTIKISGGEVKAEGGSEGAGIGGGSGRSGGTIEISGGKVDASSLGDTKGAAGIGGGYQGSGGTIEISGGTVKSVSGLRAAGIGGGYKGDGGTIIISGGTTDARNGRYLSVVEGMGIGCGYEGNMGTVSISGGTVRANGYNAGIAGSTTLSYTDSTRADISIWSNSYSGTVIIPEGNTFTDSITAFTGSYSSSRLTEIANKTLVPWSGLMVRIGTGEQGRISLNRRYVNAGETISVTVNQGDGWVLENLTYTTDDGDVQKILTTGGRGSFTMPDQSVTVCAEGGYYLAEAVNPGDRIITGTEPAIPIQWSVTVNPNCGVTMNGMKLMATIEDGSREYITMDGTAGLNVSYRNKSGEVIDSNFVSWNQVAGHTSATWSYDLGQSQSSVSKPQEVFTFETSILPDLIKESVVPVRVKVNFALLDADGNVKKTMLLSCKIMYKDTVYYLDENGDEHSCDEYTFVTGQLTSMSDGWYVVNDSIMTYNDIKVSGDVCLILCDGRDLNMNALTISKGNSLTIYAQSTEENIMGKLSGSIKSYDREAFGTVTINGGYINAAASANGAGIGVGAEGIGGRIIINGGIIDAQGGGNGGAGIGGGLGGYVDEIIITGGTVNAKGGGNDGAGIGIGGRPGASNGTRVVICGGIVNAAGANSGAGIGGGTYGPGSEVCITGGIVNASSNNGAGIGGGYEGAGGTVTISGGTVTARSGKSKAIGKGFNAQQSDGSLTINDGMRVSAGGSADNTTTMTYDARVSACQNNRYAEIVPCEASGHQYETSSGCCDYCHKEYPFKKITIVEDSHGTVSASVEGVACESAMKDQVVILTVSPVTDYVLTGLQFTAGGEREPVSVDYDTSPDGQFTSVGSFVMPGEDVVVHAIFAKRNDTIMYLNENGGTQYASAAVLSDQATTLGGWYYVKDGIVINNRISIGGEANLILCDGATLTVHGGIQVAESDSLTIYAQSTGGNMGALTIDSVADHDAGIGAGQNGTAGNITINGGKVNATGGNDSAGIGGGNSGHGGTVIINGGTITAAGSRAIGMGYGGGEKGSLTIADGMKVSTGTSADSKSAQLYDDREAACQSNSYAEILPCAAGEHIYDDSQIRCIYCHEENPLKRINIVKNHKGIVSVSVDDVTSEYAVKGQTVTLTVTLTQEFKLTGLSYTEDGASAPVAIQYATEDDRVYVGSFVMPARAVTVRATYEGKNDLVMYLDAEGRTRYVSATSFTNQTSIKGWFYVRDKVTFDTRISVSGEACLILCDGAELNAQKGITVNGNDKLTVYAQSEGDNIGRLIIDNVDKWNAGIGGEGECSAGHITINGGRIVVKGGQFGAGIGGGFDGNGGTINISGGQITASGGEDGAGIGGGSYGNGGNITISGGQIMVSGGKNGAGIGGGLEDNGGTINIRGGQITASGGNGGAGIGGGFTGSGGTINISGGVIQARGGDRSAGIGKGDAYGNEDGTINISGGQVTASGGWKGPGIGVGSLTMKLTKNDEFIRANSYNGDTSVAEGTTLKVLETDESYSGKISNKDYIAGKTLVLPGSTIHLIKGTDGITNGKVSAPAVANEGETVALTIIPEEGYGLKAVEVKQGETSLYVNNNNEFTMPAGNVTVSAEFAQACTISFAAGNGGSGNMPSVTVGCGASYTLPDAEAFSGSAGMSFKEWLVKIGDGNPVARNPKDSIAVTADTIVTAAWNMHRHDFVYSAEGGSIIAACTAENCPLAGSNPMLRINAPLKTTYGDDNSSEATLDGLNEFNAATGLTIDTSAVQYLGTGSTDYLGSTAPTSAGTYSAGIILTGVKTAEGDNQSVTAFVTYTINQKQIAISSVTATGRDYAENEKAVSISAVSFAGAGQTELTQDQDYTVAGEMQDDTAGDSKDVTVTVTLLNPNYSLAENTAATTVKINRISYTGTKTATGTVWINQDTANAELTLPALPAGAVYAATGTVSATAPSTPALISGTPSVSGTTLTYSTTSKPKGTSAQITVPVTGATNYHDYDVVVTITAEDKTDAGVAITGGDQAVTYGDTGVILSGTVTNAGENGAWNWSSGDESIAEIGSTTGAVTIRKTGSVTITAGYESDSTIGTAAMTLTVSPASVPIPAAASGLKWTGRELTGVPEGVGYTVADGKKTDVGAYTATASLSSKTNYRWSDHTTEDKRIAWSIAKADGPTAPSGLTGIAPTSDGGSDGRITGVSARMEYSAKKDFSDRKNCTGTEITGLAAGSYYVRVKETGTQKAGKYSSVSVPAYAAPTYTVIVKNGTGSGSYAAGVSVTIKANTPAAGKRFGKWTGADGLTFISGSASSAAASFRMPAKAVTITATYEDAAKEGDSSSKPSGRDRSGNSSGSSDKAGQPSEDPSGPSDKAKGPSEDPSGSSDKAREPSEDPSGSSDKAREPSEDPSRSSEKDKRTAKILLDAGLKVTWSKKNKIIVKIGEVPGATSYEIYAAYSGKNLKKIRTVKSGAVTITKLNGKKLNKEKTVKIKVIAKQGDATIARSITAHVAGSKNRYSYVKRIRISKKTDKSKKGKTAS